MSLVVEDGTGIALADSYISIEDATTYLTKFGNGDTWSDIDAATQEVLLRRSTRDLDSLFGTSYAGSLIGTTQALLWPRTEFTDKLGRTVSGIPAEVGQAVAELALINNGNDVTGPTDGSENLKDSVVKLDTIETHSSYFAPSNTQENMVRKITFLLAPYLTGSAADVASAIIVRG